LSCAPAGARFRPSDWAERLAGLTAAFGQDQKLAYSPQLCPVSAGGMHALVVGGALATLEPRLYQFLLGFARDNALEMEFVPDALAHPEALTPPVPARKGEPREPV
jgi:hypothetical protein